METCRKDKYWIRYPKRRNKKQWGKIPIDWENEYKLNKTIESYLFRFDNFEKGKTNPFILKSVFGNKSMQEIKKEIDWWFNKSIGTYNEIEILNNYTIWLK